MPLATTRARTKGSETTEAPRAFTVELLFECEVFLPEELVQNLWEHCRVDVRAKRSALLPLLTEKPIVGEYFLLRTELFEISRQRVGVSASC